MPQSSVLVSCFLSRSSEATGGTAAHGGVAQSGNAKKEGDADQVFVIGMFGCWRRQIPSGPTFAWAGN